MKKLRTQFDQQDTTSSLATPTCCCCCCCCMVSYVGSHAALSVHLYDKALRENHHNPKLAIIFMVVVSLINLPLMGLFFVMFAGIIEEFPWFILVVPFITSTVASYYFYKNILPSAAFGFLFIIVLAVLFYVDLHILYFFHLSDLAVSVDFMLGGLELIGAFLMIDYIKKKRSASKLGENNNQIDVQR